MRQITLTFDRDTYGNWPYRATTPMEGTPKGILEAGGASERFAIENLKGIVRAWIEAPDNGTYPKVVEVDW